MKPRKPDPLGGAGMAPSEVDSIKAVDVDRVARNHITNQGFPTIRHSLGHGI